MVITLAITALFIAAGCSPSSKEKPNASETATDTKSDVFSSESFDETVSSDDATDQSVGDESDTSYSSTETKSVSFPWI